MMSMRLSNKVGSFVRNSSPLVRPIRPSSENVFNVRKSSLPPYLRKKMHSSGPGFSKGCETKYAFLNPNQSIS